MLDIFSKFTTHYQKILSLARDLARRSGREALEAQDLLMALAAERGSLSAEILDKHGLSALKLYEHFGTRPVDAATARSTETVGEEVLVDILTDSLSPAARKIIERSVVTAWRYQHHYIGTEHLLYALIASDDVQVRALWADLTVDIKGLKHSLSSVLKSTSKFPDLTEAFTLPETKTEDGKPAATPALEFFCTDLTSSEVQKKIDPVVGREREIQRLIQILGRRTKNNPLLLGDPGVGKTAIVEGLAKRIVHGDVPGFLRDKRIMALDLGLVIAGTMYRGEFEGRLKQIMDEIKAHPEIILFIDEVHTIVGTGAAPGSLDLANLIKPALAKGLLRCIGATTQEEYKKAIESDAALERRFQVVQVAEPTPQETVAVLKGLRGAYEKFHHVRITDDAIEAAVSMSQRYVPEKFLPDKAIDLLDEAASRLRTSREEPAEGQSKRALTERLKQLIQAKELAIKQENFELATAHKDEAKKVQTELDALNRHQVTQSAEPLGTVGRQEIAEVVAHVTGVALTELMAQERTKLAKLEEILQARVVGQTEAVVAVAKAIRRGRLGLGNPGRPLGSFIFLGPSGVGKTELAKVIAEVVFEDTSSLIRLDMSEFSEAFNISKLIGAPAGYVGYKDSNKLTDLVRRKPASVILFDEVEKAHPDVFNLLLQVLEDGHLTDAAGKQVNFKNALVIMTSNLGLKELTEQANFGFTAGDETRAKKFEANYEQATTQLMADVKRFFRPEFLNRLDGVIVFKPLSEASLAKIVALQLEELNERLVHEKVGVSLKLGRGAAKAIAELTFSPQEGARGIRRFLRHEVEDQLTNRLLSGKLKLPAKLTLKLTDKHAVLE